MSDDIAAAAAAGPGPGVTEVDAATAPKPVPSYKRKRSSKACEWQAVLWMKQCTSSSSSLVLPCLCLSSTRRRMQVRWPCHAVTVSAKLTLAYTCMPSSTAQHWLQRCPLQAEEGQMLGK